METLLYAQNILLKDYSEIETEYFNSLNERIDIIKDAYDKITEIEMITLTEIIKYEN